MKETAYLLQAALIGAWWAGLAASDDFFAAFQFAGIPPTAFWAFFAPDVILIAALSALRAYRRVEALEPVILGAFAYATLYCVSAAVLTGSGALPTALMLAGIGYNLFLRFGGAVLRASTTDRRRNMAKTLVQVVCIWTLALVVLPYVVLDAFGDPSPPKRGPWLVVVAALFAGFSALGLSGAYVMVRDGGGTPLPLDQTNRLVVSGPYRYVRNPMAVAGIGQGLSIALLFRSLPLVVYAALGAVVWQCAVRPVEERDLAARFGDAYRDYRRRVRCWLPTFPRRAG